MTIEERILEIERRLEDMKRQSQAALALATACVETLERVREPRFSWGGSSSLEQRAATEESSAPEPSSMSNASAGLQKIQEIQEKMQEEGRTLASLFDKALEPFKAAPAPAAPPLWREVRGAVQAVPGEFDWVAAQLAVADWLAAREHCGAASALRNEARRAREGA